MKTPNTACTGQVSGVCVKAAFSSSLFCPFRQLALAPLPVTPAVGLLIFTTRLSAALKTEGNRDN